MFKRIVCSSALYYMVTNPEIIVLIVLILEK